MNLSSFKYLLKEGLKNLIHNKLMSLASIGVLTACLLVVGFSALISEDVNKIIDFFGEQSTAEVFLKDDITNEKIENIQNTLKNNDKIKHIHFISKDEALKFFSKKMNNSIADQILLEDNVLPASIEVVIKNVSFLDEVMEDVNKMDGVDFIKVPNQVADTIKELEKTLGWFELILITTLIIVSLVIISNTIRATVFARRREIAIMKQVGATDNFVRFPFVVEGVIIGLISAIVAFITTSVVYKTVILVLMNSNSPFLNLMFSNLVNFKSVSHIFALNFLAGGIGAGVVGSLFSLKRYLKI